MQVDREQFPPNNLLLALAGAGILWMGWTGFNGGDPFAANVDSSLAVLNTHICATTSLLVWTFWDTFFFKKPSAIGAIQGMITGLVCITPGAGKSGAPPNSSVLNFLLLTTSLVPDTGCNRSCSGMGCIDNGHCIWKCPLVHHDVS